MNRLRSEYKESIKNMKNSDGTIQLAPIDDTNLFKWIGIIKGPIDTPYYNGSFKLKIDIPQNYPLSPPNITFITPIFHPNIHWKTGDICLDILKDQWTPVWSLNSVCLAIIALLSHPAADSPLNCDAGNIIRAGDNIGFETMAKMYTIEYASTKLELN